MSRRPYRLKYLAAINARSLCEDEPDGLEFRYVDISTVGRGELVAEPQLVRFGDAPSRARRLVKAGDTIISTVRTYLRAVWPVSGRVDDLVVSTGFAVISPGPRLDARFLGWWAQSDHCIEEIVARSVGVSYPAVNVSDIGDLRVALPGLAEQRESADFLDPETARIDALMDKKRRLAVVLLERLAAEVSNATKITSLFEASARRDAAAVGWTFPRLRRCFSSMDYGIGNATEPSGSYPVLGMGNVGEGQLFGDPVGYVSEVDRSLLLEPSDLLFNRTNSLALVGKVAMFPGDGAKTTFASYLVRLRTSELAEPAYMNYVLNTREFLGLARSCALPSVGQANLNPSRYASLPIPLPPRDLQRQIVGELDELRTAVEGVCARLERQISLLGERRRTVITAAATGQLDVVKAAA